jgi:acyl-CoA synthetase (NDP forming)
LAAYGEFRERSSSPAAVLEANQGASTAASILGRAGNGGASYLFTESLEILQAYGMNVAAWSMASSESELISEVAGLTYPLCLKAVSQDIVHKSDSGGLALGIIDQEELVLAYRRLLAEVRERAPQARVSAVLVQEMAPKGKELMIGAKRDPSFGPCLIVGAGGIYTEILGDYAFRLAPVTEAEARDMIAELAFSKILAGARGELACHQPSIVEALLKVSQLICDHPEIREIDLNPLIANERGAVIVDSRIIL